MVAAREWSPIINLLNNFNNIEGRLGDAGGKEHCKIEMLLH